MKNLIKAVLQAILGYERYLRLFAWFKVKTLRWDRREADFFRFLDQLPEDGLVLDVGANLGFLCVHAARRMRRGGVVAFEPLPDNFAVLQHQIRRFKLKNVAAYPIAIGDENGEVEMILPVHGHARQQGLGHIADKNVTDDGTGIRFRAPIRRLDDLLDPRRHGQRVAAIKIDVENFERFVLRGARRILQQDRPLVYLELWDNDNRRASFALAEQIGYRVMVNEPEGLTEYTPVRHRHHGNFFLISDGVRRAAPRLPEKFAAVARVDG